MELHRLRLQLDDAPGRLGEAADALGRLGVNIVGLGVQTLDGARRIDDLLVDLTVPVDLPAIEHALRAVGCDVDDLRPAAPRDLTDHLARALEVAGRAAAGGGADAAVVAELARRLVRAERSWVGPAGEMPLHGVAPHPAATSSPEQAQGTSKLLPAVDRPTWCLAIPFDGGAPGRRGAPRVLVLVRRGHRFSFSETARVQALLRVVSHARTGAQAAAPCASFPGTSSAA